MRLGRKVGCGSGERMRIPKGLAVLNVNTLSPLAVLRSEMLGDGRSRGANAGGLA